VGARRPSVSVAIKTLEARGFLVRTAQRRYLLRRRDPSTQPAVIGDWDQCMLALGL
jgi:DNA-binding MarR family transcriptional regulator